METPEKESESEVSNRLAIELYLHCGMCLEEIPEGISPQEWASLEVGWTGLGIQVWCKRHECNVVNIDFEGHQHPAEMTRFVPKLEAVK